MNADPLPNPPPKGREQTKDASSRTTSELAIDVEGLTKRLLRPILVSSAFAQICPRPLVSLGFHPVRGLYEPEEVFGLPE